MNKTFSLFTLLLLFSLGTCCGQSQAPARTGSLAFGIYGNTYGTGLEVQFLSLKKNKDIFFDVTFGSCRSLKERKIESAYVDQQGKDFFWDKKNYFYVLAPTFGFSKTILGRSQENRMSVRLNFSAGPLIGLLKPYFVEIAVPISSTEARVEIKEYDANLYSYGDIVGEADFFLGLDHLKIAPGARVNTAAVLDFSGAKDFIRAIQFGLFGDFYPVKPRILDQGPNKRIFVGGSIAFLFGNKF